MSFHNFFYDQKIFHFHYLYWQIVIIICQNLHWQLISSILLPSALPYRRPKAMPGPDGYRELCPCQNFPASKTYCPPKPPLKGEKWCRATDFILRRDVQEKDHQCQATQNSTAAQTPHQGVATHSLVAVPKIKPIPKPRLLKTQFHVDQSQPVHNSNMNYVASASDPACSGTPHRMSNSNL